MPKKSIIERPISLIINTDKLNKPGQHWVALSINKNNNVQYLDSYGFSPIHNEIINFLTINKIKTIQYNSQQWQSVITFTYGAYCVLFIKMRCNDLNYFKFLTLFTKNKLRNELIVTKLI